MPRLLPKSIPFLLPGIDYPCPTDNWTQEDWNKHFRLLVVRPEYAYFQLHEIKRTERRKQKCPSQICLVKTSDVKINTEYVSTALDKSFNPIFKSVPGLRNKRYDYVWWVQTLRDINNSFLFLCKFSMHPVSGQSYPCVHIKARDYPKVWYITHLTPLQGMKGIKNKCKSFGNQFPIPINRSLVHGHIKDHVKLMKVEFFKQT